MEKILDWLKGLKDKLIEFWNKYTAKQKTVIIVVVSMIVLGLAILGYILSQTSYTRLRDIEDTKVLGEVLSALEGDNIDYRTESINGEKATRIMVDESKLEEANNLLVKNGYLSEGMTWDQAFEDESMSTSSEERQTKYKLALQNDIRKAVMNYEGVSDATVIIDVPVDDNRWSTDSEETSVSVLLQLNAGTEMTSETAKSMAYHVANAVGNKTTKKIVITDTKKNLLFGKLEGDGLGSSVSDIADFKVKLQNQWADNVSMILLKQGYDDVSTGVKGLVFDMDKITELQKEYTVAEGNDQGYLKNSYSYKSNGSNSASGIPGTDSNGDETDTMLQDNGSSSNETTLDKYEYLPNELVKNIEREQGALKKDESSLAIVVTKYRIVREETVEESGALKDTSWEDYIEKNKQPTEIEVPDNVYQLVSSATGVQNNKITINGIEKPVFQSKQGSAVSVTNYLMIILAVLIAALLVFVIIKGTSPVEVTESEPELSVEDLLATTAEESSLEDIEVGEKSELRRLIDKFVDDNPEAVALLLRNWINDDWG